MSNNEKNITSAENARAAYNKSLHRIGTITMLLIGVVTFFPTIYVSIFKEGFPGWGVLLGAAAAMVGKEFFSWILAPVVFFPMVGVAGLYMGYTAGNIATMRVPAAMAAQNAISAETGSHKAEAASVFGIAASVVVNLFFLVIVILFGDYLLSIMPESIRNAFDYAVPAIYGAVVVTMMRALKRGG